METSPGVVEGAPRFLSDEEVVPGAVLAPWILAIPPVVWLSRFVDRLYRRKLLSELTWLMTSFWFAYLTIEMASGMHDAGFHPGTGRPILPRAVVARSHFAGAGPSRVMRPYVLVKVRRLPEDRHDE